MAWSPPTKIEMSENQFTVILNGRVFGSYSTEDEAILVGDRIFKDNPRSTVKVLHGDTILMELP